MKVLKKHSKDLNGDLVGRVIDYEDGKLTEEETVEFFQDLLDTGLVYNLQGHYHRTLQALMDKGLVHHKD